jgi:elongator complex protein 3
MRAQMNDFDVPKQILNRLRALEITGHVIDKCDIRTIGGTWSFYPHAYQEMVIRSIYDAHSNYPEFRSSII